MDDDEKGELKSFFQSSFKHKQESGEEGELDSLLVSTGLMHKRGISLRELSS